MRLNKFIDLTIWLSISLLGGGFGVEIGRSAGLTGVSFFVVGILAAALFNLSASYLIIKLGWSKQLNNVESDHD